MHNNVMIGTATPGAKAKHLGDVTKTVHAMTLATNGATLVIALVRVDLGHIAATELQTDIVALTTPQPHHPVTGEGGVQGVAVLVL